MINSLQELKEVISHEINSINVPIDRIKETTSNQSIYIYTNKGIIRLSTHHNQLSFDKCLCSITIPIRNCYKNVAFNIGINYK